MKILYVSEVPIECTHAGMILLYRLFEELKFTSIKCMSTNTFSIDKRNPNIEYFDLKIKRWKLIDNRWNMFLPYWKLAQTKTIIKQVKEYLGDWTPDVIITVPHGYLCFAALELAKKYKKKLITICHDDLLETIFPLYLPARYVCYRKMEKLYGLLLRSSSSVFAISPGMKKIYDRLYKTDCTLLLPNRGKDSIRPEIRIRDGEKRVVSFAGTLFTGGVVNQLAELSHLFAKIGWTLALYTKGSFDNLIKLGFNSSSTVLKGFFPSKIMAEMAADESDYLILPASFLNDEKKIVETIFPSKLADYTAIGIPIIIWGPEYCAAIQWNNENGQPCFGFTSSDAKEVVKFLEDNKPGKECLHNKVENTIQKGNQSFDFHRNFEIFNQACLLAAK